MEANMFIRIITIVIIAIYIVPRRDSVAQILKNSWNISHNFYKYLSAVKMKTSERKLPKSFPFEIKETNENTSQKYPEMDQIFVGPKSYCFVNQIKDFLPELYNFEARSDDVWVLGVPRSGTTLTTELAWLLCNDLDYKKASETVMDLRFPLLENAAYLRDAYKKLSANLNSNTKKIAEGLSEPAWESLAKTTEKRFIKTHLPLSLAPSNILTSGCKVIYLARNPKDVCVSVYCLMRSFTSFRVDENFENFWNRFRDGLNDFTPFFEHVKEGWEVRNNPNVLFLLYENYAKDTKQTIRTLTKCLDKEISDRDLETLLEHVKIDNFRKNKSVNNDHLRELGILDGKNDSFIRKGGVGGSRDYFRGHLETEADDWIRENLGKSDLTFSI